MKVIIESTNFKPSASLNKFVNEKALAFVKLDKRTLYAEFNLTAHKGNYTCTILINLAGKDIVATKTSDDMHLAILLAIVAAKRGMRLKKMKRMRLKKTTI